MILTVNIHRSVACFLTCTIILLSSCKEKGGNAFTINGEIKGAANERVVLETFMFPNINGDPKTVVIDTARTDGDGRFTMKNYLNERSICRLKLMGNENFYVLLNLKDETVNVQSDKNDVTKTEVKGSQPTAVLYKFITDVRNANTTIAQIQSMIGEYRRTGQDSLAQKYAADMNNDIDAYFTMIKTFADTTHEISNSVIALESLVFDSYFTDIKEVADKRTTTSDSASLYLKELNSKVQRFELMLQQQEAQSFIGKPAPDIALKNADGKEYKLSDLKGKYVLLDFWASWCGPCRKENPNVVAVYNKYSGSDFTIFSVSLDTNKDAWIKAIAKDNLSWPYHVSDLAQWSDSEVAKLYNITGIPMNFLLDKDGKVIAENLRGAMLENKVAELVKQ